MLTSITRETLDYKSILAWRIVFFACAVAAVFCAFLLDPAIEEFSHRIIGISVAQNTDPYYRNNIYIFSVIAALSLCCGVFLSARFQPTRSTGQFIEERTVAFSSWILLSCSAANLIISFFVNQSSLYIHGAYLAAALFVALIFGRRMFSLSENHNGTICALLLASSQSALALFMISELQVSLVFWLISLAVYLILLYFRYGLIDKKPPSDQYSIPLFNVLVGVLAASPLLLLVANEISYFVGQREWPLRLEGALVVLLFLYGTYLFAKVKNESAMMFAVGLCVLASSLAVNEYRPEIVYNWYDVFHMGESILPLQQWSEYKLIPYIDYMPVHGLFDMLPHFLYQQLSNSSPFEALIWGNGYFDGWVMRAIYIALLYTLLAKILHPISAFFLLWLLPSFHLIEPYYAPLLIPAIHILNLKSSSNKNIWWAFQWLITAFLVLWRLDFGIVVVVSNFALAVIYSWHIRRTRPFLECLFIGFFTLTIIVLIIFTLTNNIDILATLSTIARYTSDQILVASYASFHKGIDHRFIIQYIIFPLSTCVVASYCISNLIRRTESEALLPLSLLIVYLSAAGLIISLRSLHRHSLIEGLFNNYLFLLVILLFLVFYWYRWNLRSNIMVHAIAALITISFLVIPKTENSAFVVGNKHRTSKWEYPSAINNRPLPLLQAQNRLSDKVAAYDGFTDLMKQTLQEGQTFYDFSNAPLLYALANVRLPTYITETVYQSSSALQHQTLLDMHRLYQNSKLPYVVFRQNNLLDHLDGVDNALRSYRIAEFIYKKYIPCFKVGRFDIWIDGRLATTEQCQNKLQGVFNLNNNVTSKITPLSLDYLKQHINFYYIPYIWANKDTGKEIIEVVYQLNTIGNLSNRKASTASAQGDCRSKACYFDVEISTTEKSVMDLHFNGAPQLSFNLLPGTYHYRIRISALWSWYREEGIPSVELTSSSPFQLNSAKVSVLK